MNRLFTRTLAAGMCLAMLGSLAGCAGANGESTSQQTQTKESGEETVGWKKYATEQDPVTLSWYINYSWFTTDWGRNEV